MQLSQDYPFGYEMLEWARCMWSYPRSITGVGVRETIGFLKAIVPGLRHHSVASGTQIFDWMVPDEYFVSEAYIEDVNLNRLVDIKRNHLHLVGYSMPVDVLISKDDLDEHLYSIPDKPDAIPYITSYYKERWGFCVTQKQRDSFKDEMYHVVIKSEKFPGKLDYADVVIPGEIEDEILLSTYICHPNLANDNLSGIVMAAALARWIAAMPQRRYTYRVVFVPETIGAMVYIHKHLDHLKHHVKAGYVLTCCGDERAWTLLSSRHGDTLADRTATKVLHTSEKVNDYRWREFAERGSDERQYCWPGIDLPVCSVMRSMYGEYPEYHTSLDNLEGHVVTERGLEGTLSFYKELITLLENNKTYVVTTTCEPMLSKHNLYPDQTSPRSTPEIIRLLGFCDGKLDLLEISSCLGLDMFAIIEVAKELERAGLIKECAT